MCGEKVKYNKTNESMICKLKNNEMFNTNKATGIKTA